MITTRCKKVLLLLLLQLVLAATVCAGGTISIRSDTWMPYNGDPTNPKTGYMIEVMREIFVPQGYTIDYQVMPWTDSIAAVKKGTFSAVVGAMKEDAPGFVFPSETFGLSGTGLFVKGGTNWKYTGYSSLMNKRLGIIDGYAYNEELDGYIKSQRGTGKIVVGKGDSALNDLIDLLLKGKIDVLAEDASVLLNVLIEEKIPPGQIVNGGTMPEKEEIYVAFSPAIANSKELAAKFDEGIRKLRANGKLKSILSRYGLNDWKAK